MRQLRENFDTQLKKGKVEKLYIISEDAPDINCKITTLFGHKGQISSLAIGEFDEHLLISSGYDNRVKVWLKDRLVGDLNVNVIIIVFSDRYPIYGKSKSAKIEKWLAKCYKVLS